MDLLTNPSGGLNLQVVDTSAAWANSAVLGTAVSLDVTLPALLAPDGLYVIVVTNPSADTDLTVIVKNKVTLGGAAKYPEVGRFPVAKNTPDGVVYVVQGWLVPEGGRITLSNDSAVSGAGAFTAYVHARAV